MKTILIQLGLGAYFGVCPVTFAEAFGKNSLIKDAERAIKAGHFEPTGIEGGADGDELSVWGVGEGRLIMRYSAQTGRILGMGYWLSVPGPKTGEALSFRVRSFDPITGQMRIETREPDGDSGGSDQNRSVKCGQLFEEIEKMMRDNGLGAPEMMVSGDVNNMAVWGVNGGLLIAAYRKDSGKIAGLTYHVCVPGGDVSKNVSFKVDLFDPKSGLLTIQVSRV